MRVLCLAVLMSLAFSSAAQSPPQLGTSPLDEVVAAMTTPEKASLLVGMGFRAPIPGLPPMAPEDAAIPERVPGAAGRTHAVDRLGIPSLTLSDGPAGVRIDPVREGVERTFYATAFPVATQMASAWDPDLVREVGAAFGREAREYGVDVLLAPAMNLHRNPLGGRNFEYYSEDPVVSGRTAAAFVRGVEAEGVGTSIKHFAANNQEWNRMQLDARIGERALRELYLRGFEIGIREGEPMTVMSAYNRINGQYASESRDLLTTILRDEWGYQGFVMTDWFAGSDAAAQVGAGNDLMMPGNPGQSAAIVAAVESGALSMADLDASVTRVLGVVLQSPTFLGVERSDAPDLAGNAALARRAGAEGMVLLKNERTALPLRAGARLALFGNGGYRLVKGGTGSGDVNAAGVVELNDALAEAGFGLDPTLGEGYDAYLAEQVAALPDASPFFLPPPIPEWRVPAVALADAAREADLAVVVLSRNSGEFADRGLDGDFDVMAAETALVRSVTAAFHREGKAAVVVLNIGGVIETASWKGMPDAILLAWQPGQEAGHAIVDVLTGAVAPSGKLPMTFPVAYDDVPSADSWPGVELPRESDERRGIFGVPATTDYQDGLYVGYRYYDTFGVAPSYPFGFGLGYTTFGYGPLALSGAAADGEITAKLTVTNTGRRAGREVVQLYVDAPDGALPTPAHELRAFAKTGVLQPGASETLTLTLGPRDLTSYDPARSAWVAQAGTYGVHAGASSRDLRQRASFDLAADMVVEQAHPVLRPVTPLVERTPPGE